MRLWVRFCFLETLLEDQLMQKHNFVYVSKFKVSQSQNGPKNSCFKLIYAIIILHVQNMLSLVIHWVCLSALNEFRNHDHSLRWIAGQIQFFSNVMSTQNHVNLHADRLFPGNKLLVYLAIVNSLLVEHYLLGEMTAKINIKTIQKIWAGER